MCKGARKAPRVATGVLVMFLAGLLAKRTAKAPPPDKSHPVIGNAPVAM
jgi:hypothetical protein